MIGRHSITGADFFVLLPRIYNIINVCSYTLQD